MMAWLAAVFTAQNLNADFPGTFEYLLNFDPQINLAISCNC